MPSIYISLSFSSIRRAVDRKILAVENRRLQPGLSKQTLASATARPLVCHNRTRLPKQFKSQRYRKPLEKAAAWCRQLTLLGPVTQRMSA
jgi:hypothetical protein